MSIVHGTNVIHVDGDVNKYMWDNSRISISSMGKIMYYDVLITKDHPKYDKVYKPLKKYTSYEFEWIFKFDYGCRNYDKNKMITIIN